LTAAGGGSSSCTDEYRFTAPQDIHATGTEFNNNDVLVSWNDGTAHTNQVLTLPTGTAGVGGYNTNNIIYNAVYLDMFVSHSINSGQLSTTYGGNDAITNADALCSVDQNNPQVNATYKALLVAKNTTPTLANSRYACTTQSCSAGESYNWVLQSKLRYASLSNYYQIIGTTNESGVFTSALLATIDSINTTESRPWTGLVYDSANTQGAQAADYYDWMTYYPGYYYNQQIRGNCDNWTSNTPHVQGEATPLTVGAVGNTLSTSNAFSARALGCDSMKPIICVQQP
jgi:hypothetical protein